MNWKSGQTHNDNSNTHNHAYTISFAFAILPIVTVTKEPAQFPRRWAQQFQDYFYYSQIRSQDENTTRARVLDGMIPVEEIPHLMCALGYFPTQLEITNMTNEVKYSKFAETSDLVWLLRLPPEV